MMTARSGDANLNGLDEQQQQQRRASQLQDDARRRLTRQFGPTAAAAATDSNQQQQFVFKEFTRDSLAAIQRRKLSKVKRFSVANVDAAGAKQRLEPDPYLASGVQLPQYILRRVPPDLIGKPIEDIDPYYADKEVSWTRAVVHELGRLVVQLTNRLRQPTDFRDHQPGQGAHQVQRKQGALPVRPIPSNQTHCLVHFGQFNIQPVCHSHHSGQLHSDDNSGQ